MFTYADLAKLQAQSLKMQGHIRHQTYSPEMEKTLRRFSSWEVSELIFKILLFNSAFILSEGEVQKDIHKTLLPTYDI